MPRLNYTGRKRIAKRHARVTLVEGSGGPASFTTDLSLVEYDLPDEAPVYVEAYRQTQWMRFQFGRVGDLRLPDDCALSEFDSPDEVRFRVKVTSVRPMGQLLALADRIRPRLPEQKPQTRVPLLPVRADPSLEQEVWRLDLSDDPCLLINTAAGDKSAVVLSREFQSLVLPAAMRQILRRVVFEDRHRYIEEDDVWQSRWLRFCLALPTVDELPPEDDELRWENWVDDAVSSFCRRQDSLSQFTAFWEGRDE